MNTIAIDVGYSHVKAVTSEGKRISIPSVTSPYRDLLDFSLNGTGHTVEIRQLDGHVNRHFVGDLAVREGRNIASFTLDREKHKHPNHDILVLTAARILGAKPGATLVAGLPLAYYSAQKAELQKHLEHIHAEVSVDGGSPGRVSFGKVVIVPQGAGALMAVPDLPKSGLVCLVDIGQKTTDYVTAEIIKGKVRAVSSLCGSVENGVFTVFEALMSAFQAVTGAPLAVGKVPGILTTGQVFFRGREIDLRGAVAQAKRSTAQAIVDHVLAALGDQADFVRRWYLAGGGAEALNFEGLFPGEALILSEPVFANAEGFLKAVTPQTA